MSEFKRQIEGLVDKKFSSIAMPIQGYVPQGGIDVVHWMATVVRIPNPYTGTHPVGGSEHPWVELYGVPLPFSGWGVFSAIGALVDTSERGVLVGFRGGSIHFPYIVSFTSHVQQAKENPGTPDRKSITPSKIGATGSTPRLHSPMPPTPSTSLPSVNLLGQPGAGTLQEAQKFSEFLKLGLGSIFSNTYGVKPK